MRALELDNVSMSYGRRVLFHGLTLRAGAGEVLAVTGANGAGKSTLLKVVAGLVRPTGGRVRCLGAEDADLGEPHRLLGYAAPDVQLYAELTGDENVAFFRRLRGLKANAEQDLLARVGLPRRRGEDRVSTYSSGMRQRLKLAVSLLGDPPLLVWDEPTATLDANGVRLAGMILDEHRRRGGIAVLATNDDDEATRWADQRVHIGR